MSDINRKYDRYPGLNAFADYQADVFFGRDKEINQLFNLVAAENTVLLFAQSGVGKSSLLNAGIMPRLRQKEFFPVHVRFQGWDAADAKPADNLKASLASFFSEDNIPVKLSSRNAPLWEFIKGCKYPRDHTPVLIFDQFEEFFYFPAEERAAFITELAEVLHPHVPNRILAAGKKGKNEIPTEWHTQPKIKALFSIRSDRLFELNDVSKSLPQILKHRYELKPLTKQGAECCIVEPAAREGRHFLRAPFTYSREALDEILDFLARNTEEVESTQLQIICERIEKMMPKREEKMPKREVVSKDYNSVAGLSSFIDDYYNSRILSIQDAADRKLVTDLLENKMLFDNRKVVMIESQLLDYLQNRKNLLAQLLDNRLLREDFFKGNKVFEISHDTLIESIVKARQLKVEQLRMDMEATLRRQLDMDAASDMITRSELLSINGQGEDTEQLLLQAIAIYDHYNDVVNQVNTRIRLAKYYAAKNQADAGNALLKTALEKAIAINSKVLQAGIYEVMAFISEKDLASNTEAFKLYDKALTLFNESGDYFNYGRLSENVAVLLESEFDNSQDESVIEACLEMNKSAMSSYTLVNDYISIKRIMRNIGRVERYVQPFGYLIAIFTGDFHELKGFKKLNVGRSTASMQNDISLNNRYVSRRHLTISPDLQIDELKSLNGTTLNARPLPYGYSAKLNDGDILALANCLPFIFRLSLSVIEAFRNAWGVVIDGDQRSFTYLVDTYYSLGVIYTGEEFKLSVTNERDEDDLMEIERVSANPTFRFLGANPDEKPEAGDKKRFWYLQARIKNDAEPGMGYSTYVLPRERIYKVQELNSSMQFVYAEGDGTGGRGPYFQIILKEPEADDGY